MRKKEIELVELIVKMLNILREAKGMELLDVKQEIKKLEMKKALREQD